ncbi:MAG: SGNH/GDSL hydrolase family protein [Halobacteriaceae archaeon]
MNVDGAEVHNARGATRTPTGLQLDRLPETVRTPLNDKAEDNYQRPTGVEIRFVADGPVEITLSCLDGESTVAPYWGPFECDFAAEITVGEEPETIEMEFPEHLADVGDDALPEGYFAPRVGRLVLRGRPTVLHGVEGDTRPPRDAELPDRTLLAYGTSITQGGIASRFPLAYASRAARGVRAEHVNLGTGGSAFCEPEIADHIAARDDWDAAVLSVSVNMIAVGFTAEEFRERAAYLVDTVAAENPEKPVVAITLFPQLSDVCPDRERGDDWTATADEYREVLRDVVEEAGHDNLHLLEGPDLLTDPTGLSTDLLHPADPGMIEIGANLGRELDGVMR